MNQFTTNRGQLPLQQILSIIPDLSVEERIDLRSILFGESTPSTIVSSRPVDDTKEYCQNRQDAVHEHYESVQAAFLQFKTNASQSPSWAQRKEHVNKCFLSYKKAAADAHNKLMHALNGNIKPSVRVPVRPQQKKKQNPPQQRKQRPKASSGPRSAYGSSNNNNQIVGVAASYSRKITSTGPTTTRTVNGMRIRHRELVTGTLLGSIAYTNQLSLAVQPGVAATFPWLAPQANQWEQYKCHKLVVEYVPIVGTSTQGDVIISPDYDSSDPIPTTEVAAANNAGTVQDSCWKNLTMRLDMSAAMGLGPRKYVRPCAIAGDIKTFDVAKVFVGTVNNTGASAVGKIFIEYDFEFFVPQNSPSPATAPNSTSMALLNGNSVFVNGATGGLPLQNIVFDPLGFFGTVAAPGVWVPPAGTYRVEAQVSSFDSNALELFQMQLQFLKNGANVPNGALVSKTTTINNANPISLTLLGVITCSGSDTLSLAVTLQGPTGVLSVLGGFCQMLVSLA